MALTIGQVAVAGQENPALGGSLTHQLGVIDPRVIGSVVAQRTQPARKPPDIAVGEKPGLHRWITEAILESGAWR